MSSVAFSSAASSSAVSSFPEARSAESAAAATARKGSRRILAVVLPHLLCELALEGLRIASSRTSMTLSSVAFAVVVTDKIDDGGAEKPVVMDTRASGVRVAERSASLDKRSAFDQRGNGWLPGMREQATREELQPKTRIDAVSHRARQFGVRPGQTIAEARALLSELQICELPRDRIRLALERIADSLLKFASVIAFDVGMSSKMEASRSVSGIATIWLDVGGIGHLFGGEPALAREVSNTVRALGHRARVAIANGPHLSRAFACWPIGNRQEQVLSEAEVKAAVPSLPVTALPVDPLARTWLARLGVLTLADLEKIPRKVAASRLGKGASRALDLLRGKDDEPLVPYVPKALPKEEVAWDEPVTGSEPLLFALRGLSAKISARLEGRGLAAQRLRVTVLGDYGVARFRGVERDWQSDFELASPLCRANELWKVISARLSQAVLAAPSVGLRLEVLEQTTRQQRQLDLASADSKLDGTTKERMAVLFGELSADIGDHRFGVLTLKDSHRPEKQSSLEPANSPDSHSTAKGRRSRSTKKLQARLPGLDIEAEATRGETKAPGASSIPTRLLNPPLPIHGTLKLGELWPFGLQVYSVKQLDFIHRIDGIEWWSKLSTSRDYYRVWLENPSGSLDVLVFCDRVTGNRFVQGFYD